MDERAHAGIEARIPRITINPLIGTTNMDKPYSDMLRACVSMQYATLELLDGEKDRASVIRAMLDARNQMDECLAVFRKVNKRTA